MRSFLGVPIMIGGEVWGNLYFAEKEDAREFSEADEQAAVVLAEWAAKAIAERKRVSAIWTPDHGCSSAGRLIGSAERGGTLARG